MRARARAASAGAGGERGRGRRARARAASAGAGGERERGLACSWVTLFFVLAIPVCSLRIQAPSAIDLAAVHAAFGDAYADYPVPSVGQLSVGAFGTMLLRRGICWAASRVATVDGRVVSFWLVGVDDGVDCTMGIEGATDRREAYVITTGTLPSWRGRGLASRLWGESKGDLRARGATRCTLEVLAQNTQARRVYERGGFATHRKLAGWTLRRDALDEHTHRHAAELSAASHGSAQAASVRFETARARLPASAAMSWWDWPPSWQCGWTAARNAGDAASELHAVADLSSDEDLSLGRGTSVVGYATLLDGRTLAQLAVHPNHRRRGIGARLLRRAMTAAETLSIPNIDAAEGPTQAFLSACGACRVYVQEEMRCTL